MSFHPLLPSSSPHWYINCLGCDLRTTYGNAAQAGWSYDSEGEPFLAYYCPRCQKRESNEQDSTQDS